MLVKVKLRCDSCDKTYEVDGKLTMRYVEKEARKQGWQVSRDMFGMATHNCPDHFDASLFEGDQPLKYEVPPEFLGLHKSS